MTAYARQEGGDGLITWTWELKSVNARALDVRCRLPSAYDTLEPDVRGIVQKTCARGSLQVSLTVDRGKLPTKIRLNREVLEQVVAQLGTLEETVAGAPPRLDGLLAFPGVVETVEEEETREQLDTREAAMKQDLVLALDALGDMRRAEGQRLHAIASGHLDEIERLSTRATEAAGARPEAIRERLRAQVEELLQTAPALPEERVAQEAAILITKADVREELDRLNTHVSAARELLAQGGSIGRRLDFLCQELNREANTLCSKSWDVALTRVGLDLKAAVEQLREQVQNIE